MCYDTTTRPTNTGQFEQVPGGVLGKDTDPATVPVGGKVIRAAFFSNPDVDYGEAMHAKAGWSLTNMLDPRSAARVTASLPKAAQVAVLLTTLAEDDRPLSFAADDETLSAGPNHTPRAVFVAFAGDQDDSVENNTQLILRRVI